jgi:hypothetical protein
MTSCFAPAISIPLYINIGKVLLCSTQAAAGPPLELNAAKSQLLHSEPAAGAVGLAMLARRLVQDGRCDCGALLTAV